MKKVGAFFEFSATDLVGHLDCHHLTALDRAVAEGALARPRVWNPLLQNLSECGAAHEQSYVEHLTKTGLDPVRIDGIDVTTTAVAETRSAIQRGAPATVQAALTHEGWNGRTDILRRVEAPTRVAASDLRRSQLPLWLFHQQPSSAVLPDEEHGQRGVGS